MRPDEIQAHILWTLTRAEHRVRRVDLLRRYVQYPEVNLLTVEAAYERLLSAGEIREERNHRKVYVRLAPKALSWWSDQM